MNKKNRNMSSLTLIELIISVIIVAIMILSFYSLETYGHSQVISADRRAKVQNELAYALEHMSKYVQQANGNINNPGIMLFPAGNPTGFQVRVDFNHTPADLTDDPWVRYRLRQPNNILEVSCNGGLGCPAAFNEDLTPKLCSGFAGNSILPAPLPANPSGFYVLIADGGSSINISLVGRYYPTQALTPATRLTNPQVAIRTKLTCNNYSTH
jgi:hypothetical protein